MNNEKKLSQKIVTLEKENLQLKEEIESLKNYVQQLEDFLKDEANLHANEAEEHDITQIRTFSRGKESAFQYVLDNLKQLKPKKE